jgi:hypothetical protein
MRQFEAARDPKVVAQKPTPSQRKEAAGFSELILIPAGYGVSPG